MRLAVAGKLTSYPIEIKDTVYLTVKDIEGVRHDVRIYSNHFNIALGMAYPGCDIAIEGRVLVSVIGNRFILADQIYAKE